MLCHHIDEEMNNHNLPLPPRNHQLTIKSLFTGYDYNQRILEIQISAVKVISKSGIHDSQDLI
jgi:hypothetical protein